MGAPDKPSLKSLNEDMLDMIAGGAINGDYEGRYREYIGLVKGKGWNKDEFFATFTEGFIAEIFEAVDPSMGGTPAEIRQFYLDNWDATAPLYE